MLDKGRARESVAGSLCPSPRESRLVLGTVRQPCEEIEESLPVRGEQGDPHWVETPSLGSARYPL